MQLTYELDPSPQAPGEARRALERELSDALDPELLVSLTLVVSELITNSVVHGPGKPVRLELRVDPDGSVRGEVEDQGESGVIEIRRETEGAGIGGRGLTIVDALSDRWGVYEGSTHVWFELGRAAAD
jgi:anti-sigma regulatory factor (Ser/Thr protein kinase)